MKTLHSFDLADGAYPYGGLVQAKNGDFYGTTSYGGTFSNNGTLFIITPRGRLTTLHNFDGADGSGPNASLIQATDGNLYGTTQVGARGFGTVFRITPRGKLTTTHIFVGTDDGGIQRRGWCRRQTGIPLRHDRVRATFHHGGR